MKSYIGLYLYLLRVQLLPNPVAGKKCLWGPATMWLRTYAGKSISAESGVKPRRVFADVASFSGTVAIVPVVRVRVVVVEHFETRFSLFIGPWSWVELIGTHPVDRPLRITVFQQRLPSEPRLVTKVSPQSGSPKSTTDIHALGLQS